MYSLFLSAARYQNELAGVEAEQLAERFYHQAWSVMPHVGESLSPAVLVCTLVFHQPITFLLTNGGHSEQ